MAPGGVSVGFRWDTPVASRDESKDRSSLDLGRDIEWQSAAVGENLLTRAESGGRRRIELHHRIEGAGAGRHIHGVSVDEDTKGISAGHGRAMSRGAAGAVTGC